MRKLLLIVIFCFSNSLMGQVNLDSLFAVWNDTNQSETSRFKAIHSIAWDFYLNTQPDSAFYFANLEYEFAKSKGLNKQMANALNTQGVSMRNLGKYNKAIEYYTNSLIISEAIEDKLNIASSLHNIGIIYKRQGEFNVALDYYTRSLRIREEIGDKKGIISSLNNIGIIYKYRGNYARAIDYYSRSLKASENIGYKKGIASALNNIGVIYKNQGRFKSAFEYHTRSLIIKEEIGNRKGISNSLHNIGSIYDEQGDYEKAIDYLSRSLVILEEIGDRQEIANSLNYLGNIYKNLKKYAIAIDFYRRSLTIYEYLEDKKGSAETLKNLAFIYLNQNNYKKTISLGNKALNLAQEISSAIETMDASHTLSEAFKAIGSYKKALKMHELYIATRDSINSEKNQREILRQEYKYDYEKQKNEDEKRRLEEEYNNKVIRTRNYIIILSGLGILLILLIAAIFYVKSVRKRNKIISSQKEKVENQKEEIQSQADNLKITNDKLIELDHFKESMTGMIVHDLKNPLNAIINASKTFSLEKQITIMKQSGKHMLNMVMNILDVHKYEDSEMVLDKKNNSLFEHALNAISEVSFLAKQKSIRIENKISQETGVQSEKEIIERVIVNILTNAIKYTHTNGKISIICQLPNSNKELVIVKITDTGQGIPADKLDKVFDKFAQVEAKKSGKVRSTGLGLTFCKMAIEAHGGEIGVESEEGKGTTFWFSLPLGEMLEIKKEAVILPKTDKLVLSANDKIVLEPYISELRNLLVYETSSIEEILARIDAPDSETLQKWKEEISNCLYLMNEEKYRELINLL